MRELAEEMEEKKYLNAQIQETSRLLQESEANRLADRERLNAKLLEQIKLLEVTESYHLADTLSWEEEKRTLTERMEAMTEEMRTMTEETEELRSRVQGSERPQWGAFCPVLLGNWAENYINTI